MRSLFGGGVGGEDEGPVVMHLVTASQLEELAELIARKVAKGPRKEAVKVPEAALLLNCSADALRYRIRAKQVAVLPGVGPQRISMAEIDRLNGLRRRPGLCRDKSEKE